VRPLVNYLYEHSTRDIEHKWWWLLQSIYLAQHKLEDMDLALKVAMPLVDKRVPIWAQQMAAVVREKRGEMEDALKIMETIKDNADAIPERDLKYMIYFVKERLNRLDKLNEFKKIKATNKPQPDTRPKEAP
jgi:predicted Rdx family selenoprotein